MAVPFGSGDVLFRDEFPYSDGSLSVVGSASWSGPFISGNSVIRVVSNATAGAVGSLFSEAYINRTFPNDIDVLMKITTLPTGTGHSLRLGICGQGAGSATPDGYVFRFQWLTGGGNDSWRLYELTDAVYSSAIVNTTSELAAGEWIGVRRIGSTIQMYKGTTARVFSTVGGEMTDSTYSAGGRVWLTADDDDVRMDSFEVRRLTRSGLSLRGCGG